MPWSAMKTIPALEGKPREQRELFAEVANEALSKGRTEQEAIFAGTAAVNAKFKPKSIVKQQQEIPWHLKAVLEASKQASEPISEVTPSRPTLLIKNAITSDPSRSLVAAEFDKSDRLVLTFDDGQKIITRPVDIKSYVEQYVSVKTGSEGLTNPVEYIQFDTGATVSPVLNGQLTWNADEGTLNLGMHDGQVVQQIGLETFYRVKNQTGHSLVNGSVVMAVGAVGNSGQILVDYAQLDGVPERTLGLVTHTINNGENGFATHFGIVRGINTTGSDYGETWLDGDILYLHPTIAGRLTKIKPEAPNFVVTIAMVIHAHTNGQLFVRPTYGSRLADCAEVLITTPQDGETLVYDALSATWQNKPVLASSIDGGTFN